MIDKKYILDRLHNGEDIDDVCSDISAILNEAITDYKAELAKKDTEDAKRELVSELIDIINELAILEGLEPQEWSEEDVMEMVQTFTNIFKAIKDIKSIISEIPEAEKKNDLYPDAYYLSEIAKLLL